MAKQLINIGAAPFDNTGDFLREGGEKINANFDELYGVVDNITEDEAGDPLWKGAAWPGTSGPSVSEFVDVEYISGTPKLPLGETVGEKVKWTVDKETGEIISSFGTAVAGTRKYLWLSIVSGYVTFSITALGSNGIFQTGLKTGATYSRYTKSKATDYYFICDCLASNQWLLTEVGNLTTTSVISEDISTLQTDLERVSNEGKNIEAINMADFVALKSTNELTVGRNYKITDFTNYKGTVEPILLMATANNNFSLLAKSTIDSNYNIWIKPVLLYTYGGYFTVFFGNPQIEFISTKVIQFNSYYDEFLTRYTNSFSLRARDGNANEILLLDTNYGTHWVYDDETHQIALIGEYETNDFDFEYIYPELGPYCLISFANQVSPYWQESRREAGILVSHTYTQWQNSIDERFDTSNVHSDITLVGDATLNIAPEYEPINIPNTTKKYIILNDGEYVLNLGAGITIVSGEWDSTRGHTNILELTYFAIDKVYAVIYSNVIKQDVQIQDSRVNAAVQVGGNITENEEELPLWKGAAWPGDYVNKAIEITALELEQAISESILIPQQWYLITDYRTKDYIRQTSAPVEFFEGTIEQIYVQASSANTLYYDGFSKTFEGEKIGYLATRDNYLVYPTIYYYGTPPDGENSERVEIEIVDSTHFELITNPFPSNPDDESSFVCNIYDETNDIAYTFNDSNKGIDWEFDMLGFFHLLITQYIFPYIEKYIYYHWEEGSSGDQEIEILTATTMGATTPYSSFADLNTNDTAFTVYDPNIDRYGYYDAYNYGTVWTINEDDEFEILDTGAFAQLYGYMEGGVNSGDYDIVIDSATDFHLDVEDFNLNKGSNNGGSTAFYITWTDEVYEEFYYDNYGTTWEIVDNKIRLIGNTHSLLTDVSIFDAYICGQDQTATIDLTGEITIDGYLYFNELRTIDLTNSCEISAEWSYIAEELGGLIINRRVPEYDIDIDFDFRATKFRRYKILSEPYSDQVYDVGAVVNYNGTVHIKTWSEGTIRVPTGSQYYVSWAYVSPNKDYYTMGRGDINIYGSSVTLHPDTSQYFDSGFLQYYGESFVYDLALIRGCKIKYSYNTRYIESGPDIVLRGTDSYNSTVNLSQNSVVTLTQIQNINVRLDYQVIITGQFLNCTGFLSQYIGYNLADSEITNMSSVLWYNVSRNKILGSVQNFICGGSDQSYGNIIVTQIYNSRVGYYFSNNVIYSFVGNTVNHYVKGNYINAMTDSIIGYYVKDNQIYSECYGATVTQYMNNNRIYGQFGYSLVNPKQRAGKFFYLDGNDFYAYFYEAVNNNIGGTTKYNDFYSITNCIFRGNVNSNNLPYVSFNRNNILGGMSHVDKILSGTVTDTVSYNTISGSFYNFRFTGRTTMTNNVIDGDFQNGWFGGGTFASPIDNNQSRNFTYNKVYGSIQYFQGESGYVDRNVWLGNCEIYGSTYTKFNCGNGVSISDNIFGAINKGNQFLKQMIGCVIGSNCVNNIFNGNLNRVTIGISFSGNTISVLLRDCEIGNAVTNTNIPSISSGSFYPIFSVQGEIKATTYKSSDGSPGITQIIVLIDSNGEHTLTFKNGLLTAYNLET